MPAIDINVPPFPESVREGTLTAWHRKPGEAVRKGDKVADIETDKIVLDVTAPADGVIAAVTVREGATVQARQVIGALDAGGQPPAAAPVEPPKKKAAPAPKPAPKPTPAVAAPPAPSPPPPVRLEVPPAPVPAVAEGEEELSEDELSAFSPSVRRLLVEHKLNPAEITGHGRGGRLTKADVLRHLEHSPHLATQFGANAVDPEALAPAEEAPAAPPPEPAANARPEHRVKMSRLRQRIAQRLVEVQQQAAILTTFNEVNMAAVMALRARYKEAFEKEHGVKLGFMSFFVKAAVEALARFPAVNASLEGEDIVYHEYFDLGVAVSTERGLVVPVLRDAEQLSPAAIEQRIADFGKRAQAGQLGLEELQGGTFTISNGGVFGSLMSTPILNPPQSGILGMHKIQDRPVAENGQVVIRPMMYLALSYDHRLIDGREAVSFLATIKDLIEDPTRLWLQV